MQQSVPRPYLILSTHCTNIGPWYHSTGTRPLSLRALAPQVGSAGCLMLAGAKKGLENNWASFLHLMVSYPLMHPLLAPFPSPTQSLPGFPRITFRINYLPLECCLRRKLAGEDNRRQPAPGSWKGLGLVSWERAGSRLILGNGSRSIFVGWGTWIFLVGYIFRGMKWVNSYEVFRPGPGT